MAGVTKAQLEKADARAEASQRAKKLIEQAGNGLVQVHSECKANAVGLMTAVRLQVIQGYLGEAAILILEQEQPAEVQIAT